jgi:hypothetical protein
VLQTLSKQSKPTGIRKSLLYGEINDKEKQNEIIGALRAQRGIDLQAKIKQSHSPALSYSRTRKMAFPALTLPLRKF